MTVIVDLYASKVHLCGAMSLAAAPPLEARPSSTSLQLYIDSSYGDVSLELLNESTCHRYQLLLVFLIVLDLAPCLK